MKHEVAGRLVARYIPGKKGAFTHHDPMVTLEFEGENGGSIQLFTREIPDARGVFLQLKDQLNTRPGWTCPLMLHFKE